MPLRYHRCCCGADGADAAPPVLLRSLRRRRPVGPRRQSRPAHQSRIAAA
ncbi:hypothetical protein KCH_72820 [Kitasatospora cheerisanensis KCTC 2395]|uniref:Uncharacterized protein n=1 Tax=Kitasatospora cheerisanensis KCTC 2395 TaxID=1348663 RepID=A0A066YLX0_9ACTN|nr:hypothetical protein KCH_72820 [Kitasatospora cheerisanensis KCTC 2395]